MFFIINQWSGILGNAPTLQIVLFGFRSNLALHLAQSPLRHSDSYATVGDNATCLASLPLNSKSFMKYLG